MILARDRELKAIRANLEQAVQKHYDVGFDDAECSSKVVIFEAQ